jgi:hypothetical protein
MPHYWLLYKRRIGQFLFVNCHFVFNHSLCNLKNHTQGPPKTRTDFVDYAQPMRSHLPDCLCNYFPFCCKPNVIFFPSGELRLIYSHNNLPIGTDAKVVTDSVSKVLVLF